MLDVKGLQCSSHTTLNKIWREISASWVKNMYDKHPGSLMKHRQEMEGFASHRVTNVTTLEFIEFQNFINKKKETE